MRNRRNEGILSSTPRSINKIRRDLLNSAKRRSLEKGLPYNITIEDVLLPVKCPIMKVPLMCNSKYAPTLDRMRGELGYTRGNIRVISKISNQMKANATYNEVLLFCKGIKQYMNGRL